MAWVWLLLSREVSVWSQKRLGRRDQIRVQLYACTYMSIFVFVYAAAIISVLSSVSQEIRHLCISIIIYDPAGLTCGGGVYYLTRLTSVLP